MQVVSGKDKGKSGEVIRAFPRESMIVIEGVAIVKRHLKGSQGQTGRIVERPRPIHVSNVMLIDPDTKKPSRVRIEKRDGVRTRVAVKSKTPVK